MPERSQERTASKKPPPKRRRSAKAATHEPSLGEHAGTFVKKQLRRLSEFWDFSAAKDPVEAVHDLRVAARRLRTFTDVFRPSPDDEGFARAEKLLRKVMRAARPLRDLDVRQALIERSLSRATTDAERASLEHLVEVGLVGREGAVKRARKRLDRIDRDEITTVLRAALHESTAALPEPGAATRRFAWNHVGRLVTEATKDVPPADGKEHPEQLHLLRLALKRLRYTLELLSPALGEAQEALYARAQALQELLGDHHDLVVFGEFVRESADSLEKRGRSVLAGGLGGLAATLSAEQDALSARFRTEGFDVTAWQEAVRAGVGEGAG